MKIRIIDTNRGQVPSTVKEALHVSDWTRYAIKKEFINVGEFYVVISCNGYHFGIEAVK